MPSSLLSRNELASVAAATLGATVLLAYSSISDHVQHRLPVNATTSGEGTSVSRHNQQRSVKKGKTTHESAVHVTYPTTSDMCDLTAHVITPDAPQTVKTGALLKLIDVVAGVSARKHAGMSCVTVSVDSVLHLKSIHLGELVHLSASVNRAWGTSLEVGVRVVKEDISTGIREYVSHSYLTFVAVAETPKSSSPSHANQPPPGIRLASRIAAPHPQASIPLLTSLMSFFGSSAPPPTPPKPKLEPLIPRTPLEARRHILAGRRRTKRIDDAKRGEGRDGVSIEVKKRVREEVKAMHGSNGASAGQDAQDTTEPLVKIDDIDFETISNQQQKEQLEVVEMEFVAQAYLADDPAIRVDEERGILEVYLPGDVPLTYPLAEIKQLAALARSKPMQRQETVPYSLPSLAGPTAKSSDPLISPSADPTYGLTRKLGEDPPRQGSGTGQLPMRRRHSIFDPLKASGGVTFGTAAPPDLLASPIAEIHEDLHPQPIQVSQTLSRTLHLVFPEHTNSVSVLFGGQLMDWMEEAALLSARHVGRGARWSTVALDGLEFPQAVTIGEVMYFTAVVIRTFSQSCEVYVLAEGESPNGTRRVTNDALFTLAFPLRTAERDGEEVKVQQTILRPVVMPVGSALEQFAEVAEKRREARLELRKMLLRIYSAP